ncbi:MAG: T9SS type A sorting domain-containing protein [Bacteroidales bacterium]
MKDILLSLTMMLCLNSVIGQNIHFPDSNAIWSVYDQKYFVDGDSSFNATEYKKYYFSNDSIVTTVSFFALLREDTITRKVYAIAAGSTQENLLYDFSLAVNDTAIVYPFSFPIYSGPISIKVESIDSILIAGDYYTRFKIIGLDFPYGIEEYWIEGIGSTMGIFNSGITGICVTDITFPTLLCFEKEGATLYHNPDFFNCYEHYPVGIEETAPAFRSKIYPNPTNSSLKIESEKEIIYYQLLSCTGMILLDGKVGMTSFTLDISDFPPGIYLITLNTANGTIVKKIIKSGV